MVFAGYAALYVAPDEKTMHAIQRIFYFHVPSAISPLSRFLLFSLRTSVISARDKPKWDWLGVAGAEVGVVCSTIVLITGTDLGASGVGNLVDVGRATDFHICNVAAVHGLSSSPRIS